MNQLIFYLAFASSLYDPSCQNLLTTPGDITVPQMSIEQQANMLPRLQSLALQWEILDPHEVRYILAKTEDFTTDLNLVRCRYQQLKDAPPLNTCLLFPDRDTVNDLLTFNRAYRQHEGMQQSVQLQFWWRFQVRLTETDQLYQIWDYVRDARTEYYYITVRRQALKKLKETLGDDDFYNGRMPPVVPIWRFREVE